MVSKPLSICYVYRAVIPPFKIILGISRFFYNSYYNDTMQRQKHPFSTLSSFGAVFMSAYDIRRTTDEWQAEIGERLRAARIRRRLEQKELASASNVSVSAIKNLEGGKGSTLKSLINVLRALNLQDLLETLPPVDMVSPLEVARTGQAKLPQRVVKHRRKH